MVRFVEDGGEDALAPVIPLFGPSGSELALGSERAPSAERSKPVETDPHAVADPVWDTTWSGDADDDSFVADSAFGATTPARRESPVHDEPVLRVEAAEKALLRRLHARSLSVSEAQSVLTAAGLGAQQRAEIVTAFLERGYLGDAALAEQLVHSGVSRRGSGRRVIAQSLAKRGIPRDVADAALSALPDDDAERALEFARTKAPSLAKLDHDTAVRRLVGQLARRGYPGSVALAAAKQALAEASEPATRVRFR